jgi:hypothetical protein
MSDPGGRTVNANPSSPSQKSACILAYLAGAATGALVMILALPRPGSEVRDELEHLGWRVRRKAGRAVEKARQGIQGAKEAFGGENEA